ncbi:hypothetical protein ANAPH1_00134 [Anaplasma phagocytophilum]|nr:hypothetical protein ANAPH1_00134 [Anaplasma phagocytophilum]
MLGVHRYWNIVTDKLCKQKRVGVIIVKVLSGGTAAYSFMKMPFRDS